MVNLEKIRKMHQAARIFEKHGLDGFKEASNLAGEEVTMALLISLLRHSFNATNSDVEREVNLILTDEGLV